MISNLCPARKAMPTWPRGGSRPGAGRAPAATGRCLAGGWTGTDWRSIRCCRDSPPFAAKRPPLRRRGSTTPSGSSTALQKPGKNAKSIAAFDQAEPCAFEQLFTPVVEQAEALLWSDIDARAFDNLNESARACLRLSLLKELSSLAAPAIYERFAGARKAAGTPPMREAAARPAHRATINLSPK